MAATRCKLAFFSIAQWEEEAAWLRRQHQQGWKFVHVTAGVLYHFVACPPEDVVYQLDYQGQNPQEDYLQLFFDCGWEYVDQFAHYYYFRKPAAQLEGAEEGIFCDRESRLAMLRRVFYARMAPLLLLLAGAILPQVVLDQADWVVTLVFLVVLAAYALVLSQFARQYFRLLRQT